MARNPRSQHRPSTGQLFSNTFECEVRGICLSYYKNNIYNNKIANYERLTTCLVPFYTLFNPKMMQVVLSLFYRHLYEAENNNLPQLLAQVTIWWHLILNEVFLTPNL